jgi:hypothetical protein
MQECSVVFEELQETHAQYAVPGYLNRFSKLYESHFEALCTALDADVPLSNHHLLTLAVKQRTRQQGRSRRASCQYQFRYDTHTFDASNLFPTKPVRYHGRRLDALGQSTRIQTRPCRRG